MDILQPIVCTLSGRGHETHSNAYISLPSFGDILVHVHVHMCAQILATSYTRLDLLEPQEHERAAPSTSVKKD